MSDLKYEEIYDKIIVFKNPWKDLDSLVKTIVESESNPEGSWIGPWSDWYTFGRETSYYNQNNEVNERVTREQNAIKEIEDIFHLTTKIYLEKYANTKLTLKDGIDYTDEDGKLWRKMGPSICQYYPEAGIEETDLAMHYHSDYQIENRDDECFNFALTVTMYLNDDYEGGEIDFFVNNKLIMYKPEAGDVVVFPAGHPEFLTVGEELYLHGVKKVHGSRKHFIRNHWQMHQTGTPEWRANAELYGVDTWIEMEKARKKISRAAGEYQFINTGNIEDAVRIK